MRVERGEVKMKVAPPRAVKRGRTLAGLKIEKGNNRNRSGLEADRQTVGGLPGYEQSGEVSPTYPTRARCVGCVGQLKR